VDGKIKVLVAFRCLVSAIYIHLRFISIQIHLVISTVVTKKNYKNGTYKSGRALK